MEKLRKQIRESFFNPVLHFLPLLVFLIVDEFSGMNLAWKISFPTALVLLTYIYFAYKRLFTWHLVFTFLFVAVNVVKISLVLWTVIWQVDKEQERGTNQEQIKMTRKNNGNAQLWGMHKSGQINIGPQNSLFFCSLQRNDHITDWAILSLSLPSFHAFCMNARGKKV